jgi:hypothetical protein
MDRPYIATVVYALAFGALFALVLTPLTQGLLSLGLSDTAAALIAWFTVVLVPLVPARLVNDL